MAQHRKTPTLKTPTWWHTKSLKAQMLRPVSWLYALGLFFNSLKYKRLQKVARGAVISIGNLTVGGSGKTPVVSALAEWLEAKGYRVAIVSRGYGGQKTESHRVQDADTATDVGDEPCMLYNQGVASSVWVGINRFESAQNAFKAGADVVLLDDGFQHHKLYRDADVVVVDAVQKFGNGYLLPAGPLREPVRNVKRASCIVSMNGALPPHRDIDPQVPVFNLKSAIDPASLKGLFGRPVIAFCGLGHPQKFFTGLYQNDLQLARTRAFPDHHMFTNNELKQLLQDAAEDKAALVTTEKDAARIPAAIRKRLYIAKLAIDAADIEALGSFLITHLKKRNMLTQVALEPRLRQEKSPEAAPYRRKNLEEHPLEDETEEVLASLSAIQPH